MNERYNQLPTELKVQLVNAKSLVDKTRKRVKIQSKSIDLTCRLQLRDDCNAVEQCIKKLGKKNISNKEIEKFKLAILRLQTSVHAILKEEA